MSPFIESWFHVRESGSSLRTEVLGGLTTFLTMVYIVFVNPAVLSGAGMDFGAVMVATCLAAGIATWTMGLAANYPIAMAPGMGENFFFLTVVVGMQVPWRIALAAVFVSGIVFVFMNLFRLREMLINAVPTCLKHSIAAGIGLFIALIGLRNGGILLNDAGQGHFVMGDLTHPATLIALVGLTLTVAAMARGIQGAVLLGILFTTALAWGAGLVEWQGLVSMPPSLAPTFLQLDLSGLLTLEMLPVIFIFLFMAVFDAVGTLIGIGEQGGFMKDGKLPRAGRALTADATGTVVGSLLGTPTVTAYIESATGVQAGARTGLANMVTGTLFFLALFFSPLARMIGGGIEVEPGVFVNPMTAPALIIVGSLMARSVAKIPWEDMTESFPAFLVLAGIPLFWSIADGIAFGFIAYPLLKLLTGRYREVSALVYIVGGLLALRYIFL
ncbi:MAG: NCS2 family permease [Acidobacteria bacterium]|uniref:NCS2 family permease n=1 Tax=Candidatus Polarisedimenticola svalbardensis TaxID=2886004 RepID=A0A8J6XZD4_9BACT|nr:NCS2 family permease [Candidatus Polarisedimenticola svalbardensis]